MTVIELSLHLLNNKLPQAGLYEKWVADTIMETTMRSKKRRKEREQKSVAAEEGSGESGPKPLTMTHMQGAFLILTLGVLLAAVTLAGEVLHVTLSNPLIFKKTTAEEVEYMK